jgi:hypothetical protein
MEQSGFNAETNLKIERIIVQRVKLFEEEN